MRRVRIDRLELVLRNADGLSPTRLAEGIATDVLRALAARRDSDAGPLAGAVEAVHVPTVRVDGDRPAAGLRRRIADRVADAVAARAARRPAAEEE